MAVNAVERIYKEDVLFSHLFFPFFPQTLVSDIELTRCLST